MKCYIGIGSYLFLGGLRVDKLFNLKYIGILALILTLSLLLGACNNGPEEEIEPKESDKETEETQTFKGENEESPIVTMTMENDEKVIMELYPQLAPNTVNNFISLIQDDFYDGLIFHRVIPGFMIQGGDPEGSGTGGPGYSIKGEFESNDFSNELEHKRGVLSMARSQSPDSAGSQFFIIHEDAAHLDGEYAGFGQVIEGMDVVDEIVSVPTDNQDRPKEDQTIKSMTVDLESYEFNEPEIIE